ncbi:MAG TPA: TolC family protein [Desulfuromonadales bacterium]|nr:TolC family protein [Desulfuromonadales bacterium]
MVLMLTCSVSAYSATEPLSLTLSEAIRMAVEKNLDVRAELYNPAAFEADIRRNRSIYDPLVTLKAEYDDSTISPVGSATGIANESQSFLINSSISRLLWTGATVALNFNNSYTGSNAKIPEPNYWQTAFGATLIQPLLRNAGRETTEIAITVSRLSKFAALEHFNTRLLNTVAQVRTEYFKLYSLREDMEVRKVSLELARKILSDTQARVKAGVLPAMEILNAEFGAVTREKELIDAERAVKDQMDVLKLLLQLPAQTGELRIADLPSRERYEAAEQEAIRKALERPDIREQKHNLDIAERQTRVYNSKTRPDLSLTASAALTGLDNTYQRNLDKVFTFDYPAWSVGMVFSYPLGNNAAENDYRKSRLKAEQTSLQIRSLEENAINEVRTSIRGIETGFKQIEVADRGRSFAEERYRAFVRKNEVGLATTKDVLDVENDLAAAKSNQIKSLVGYASALTRYWQVTGELLEREGVRVVEGDADKLYSAASR